jgi:hypothetical protein
LLTAVKTGFWRARFSAFVELHLDSVGVTPRLLYLNVPALRTGLQNIASSPVSDTRQIRSSGLMQSWQSNHGARNKTMENDGKTIHAIFSIAI